MSNKDKKFKYVEDVIEAYLSLNDEEIEIPLAIAAAKEKQITLMPVRELLPIKISMTVH